MKTKVLKLFRTLNVTVSFQLRGGLRIYETVIIELILHGGQRKNYTWTKPENVVDKSLESNSYNMLLAYNKEDQYLEVNHTLRLDSKLFWPGLRSRLTTFGSLFTLVSLLLVHYSL